MQAPNMEFIWKMRRRQKRRGKQEKYKSKRILKEVVAANNHDWSVKNNECLEEYKNLEDLQT